MHIRLLKQTGTDNNITDNTSEMSELIMINQIIYKLNNQHTPLIYNPTINISQTISRLLFINRQVVFFIVALFAKILHLNDL